MSTVLVVKLISKAWLQGRIQEFRKGGGGGAQEGAGVGAGGGCAPSRAKSESFEQYSNTDTHSYCKISTYHLIQKHESTCTTNTNM